MGTRAIRIEEQAETMGAEGRVNESKEKVHRKTGVRQASPTPVETYIQP
jgi:hypothetical protein